jgi:hypothetical protein
MRHTTRVCVWTSCALMLPLGAVAAANSEEHAATDETLAQLAQNITQACPSGANLTQPDERDRCATKLAKVLALDDAAIGDTIRWGAVSKGDFDPAHNALTLLNTLVWRKLYLSLFAFTGKYNIETLPDESKLLRLEAGLRPLPSPEFPYPFWHSAAKWRSYQQTQQVGLYFKGGKLLAAYRAETDSKLPVETRSWNGIWSTGESSSAPPRTALFDYLLSVNNPDRAALERAYKALAEEARRYSCSACHNPANPASMNPLIIFNLPNQALSGRHAIVYALSHNEMPPRQGIDDESARQHLLKLAENFAQVGDRALAFEGQRPP